MIMVSLSGGADSSTMLAKLLYEHQTVHGVSFSYGSKHNKYENKAAQEIARYYKIPFTEIDLSQVFKGFTSSLMQDGEAIPEGHYTDESMKSTVVPGRNIIFLSILSGLGWSLGADSLAIGIHQGDHAIYPDCTIEFYKAMDTALFLGTDKRIQLIAPFNNMDKNDIIRLGYTLGVPFELTRTCYKDQPIACGKCGSCVERLEAFARLGIKDPLPYE